MIQSAVMRSPIGLNSALRLAATVSTCMPLAASSLRYSWSFCSLRAQPRRSATAACASTASCVGLSSASKVFWFTTTALRGRKAETA
ncbi:hypothetical protein D3C72_2290620 [compost metagenome]